MDAYDGTMHFYIADPADPIVRAYAGRLPRPVRADATRCRPTCVPHLRVPEELFNVQTRMFGALPRDRPAAVLPDRRPVDGARRAETSEQTLPSEAYYVVMRMPGEAEAEFLLLQPMVPHEPPEHDRLGRRPQGRADYGDTRSIASRPTRRSSGPAQIEARIDQDPVISQQISLWDQAGSKVIRGNLIVVPLGDSLIYLQPVYLQSTSSAFPEFRRIVVASPRERRLGHDAAATPCGLLLAAEAAADPSRPSPTPTPTPGARPDPERRRRPARRPRAHDAADRRRRASSTTPTPTSSSPRQALRNGDFARYGSEIALVEAGPRPARCADERGRCEHSAQGSTATRPPPHPGAEPRAVTARPA